MAERGLLLVHALAPPTRGGTAVVLQRLLAKLDGWRLEVITDRSLRAAVERGDEFSLPARYAYFPKLRASGHVTRELAALADLPLALLAGVRAGRLAKRSRPRWILSPLDGGFSQLAALVASRLSGVPRIVLVFDLWEENAYGAVARGLARLFEGRILRGAHAVIVWGQETADHYRAKHGVSCELLRIPIELPDEPDAQARPAGGHEVLVAGAIYWAQEDAVRRLARAAELVPEAELVVLGPEEHLRRRGIAADRFEHPGEGATFQRRLRETDVLFLGLSLESAHPEVIRTATPARLPEFMATGRPLLIHAPAGSHVAAYARREDFAEVVDEAHDAALAAGLRRVFDDPDRAAERARRARELAVEHHSSDAVRARFAELLERS